MINERDCKNMVKIHFKKKVYLIKSNSTKPQSYPPHDLEILGSDLGCNFVGGCKIDPSSEECSWYQLCPEGSWLLVAMLPTAL